MAISKALAQIKKEKKRFIGFVGGYLIDDGVLTLEQLDRGIVRQIRLAEQGQVTKLGQVLIDLGYITPTDLARALQQRAADQAAMKVRSGKKRK